MKTLIVGAGAVGQVYGRHLQLGGAEVSFFVRPKYADECRQGFKMYPLNRRNPRREPVHFTGFGVLTSNEEVAREKWDQVYLTISSTALRSGWLDGFARAIGDATLVSLQPGLEDRDYILRVVPADRLVCGMISLISYHAPLPGEQVPEPGMAYWFPPLSPSPYSGPAERTRAVVRALNAGGHPSVVHKDVPKEVAFPSAALMTLLTALEACDWSFAKLAHSPKLGLACDATAEASAVIARKLDARAPLGLRLLKPAVIKTVLRLAPCFVPLDLETYLRVHFTKVGDQTRLFMKTYLELGHKAGQPVAALEQLESSVGK